MIFDHYPPEFSVQSNDIKLECTKRNNQWYYQRRQDKEVSETKTIVDEPQGFFIQPIAPIHLPKPLTPLLLVSFENEMLVPAHAKQEAYLKIPIEIGCFIEHKGAKSRPYLIDVFQNVPAKYTLYGSPSDGQICQYCKSTVYNDTPKSNTNNEAILKLHIHNKGEKLQRLSKIVINVRSLNLFFSEDLVGAEATLQLTTQGPVIEALNTPLQKSMTAVVEYDEPIKWEFSPRKFTMEHGT